MFRSDFHFQKSKHCGKAEKTRSRFQSERFFLFVGLAKVTLLSVALTDASKAKEKLGWEPEITFEGLIRGMVDADIADLKGEPAPAHC